jgi:hypothetical protein
MYASQWVIQTQRRSESKAFLVNVRDDPLLVGGAILPFPISLVCWE